MFPSMSSCASTKINPICRKTWPQSTIFEVLVITSPQKLLGGFEWNLPIRLASISIVQEPNQILVGRQISHFLAPSSDLVKRSIRHLVIVSLLVHLWQIRLTFTFERICHTCKELARVCHTWKIRKNSSHVWQIRANSLKLNISEKFVPIEISKLVVRIFHTYQNVTYSCE